MQRSFSILILFAVAMITGYSQQSRPIGFVKDLSGDVFLSRASDPTRRIQLRAGKAALQQLHDGDVLSFGRNSTSFVRLIISGRIRTFTDRDGDITLHPFRNLTEAERKIDEAIARFGLPGGSRSVGSLVWWPADDGAVRLENFRIKWNPTSSQEPFKFVISAEPDGKIWLTDGIDSAQGQLTTEQQASIKQLLAQRQKDTENQNFTLTVSSEMQGSQQNTFSILSRQEEFRITAELQEWDKRTQDPLLRIIGRIDILKSAHLYCDLAEEYEAALELIPNSELLLRAALDANQRIGNLDRTHHLNTRLQAALSEDTSAFK